MIKRLLSRPTSTFMCDGFQVENLTTYIIQVAFISFLIKVSESVYSFDKSWYVWRMHV